MAEHGARRLWRLLRDGDYVNCLGAVTGNQAMQMVRAGLKAIYLSGWQVAADANTAGAMYPDQSLYPANSGPEVAGREEVVPGEASATLGDADPAARHHLRRRSGRSTGWRTPRRPRR